MFVTAYDIQDRFAFFFRSARARRDPTYDFPLTQVARATAAAPTYFEPVEVTDVGGARTYPLIDGGVYAVNPSMCAYADVVRSGRPDELALMLSLGTGAHTRAYTYDEARGWGQLEWARPLLDVVFDGVADTIEFEAGTLMGERYMRLQDELSLASDDLDDASAENLAGAAARGRGADRVVGPPSSTAPARSWWPDSAARLGLAAAARQLDRRACAARAGAPRARTAPP